MSMKIAFAAVAALGLFSGAAYAKSVVTATLAAPVAERTQVIASGVVWTCAADSCQAKLDRAPTARVCMDLAREVGQIAAFGALTAEDVARCNTRAAAPPATAVAQR